MNITSTYPTKLTEYSYSVHNEPVTLFDYITIWHGLCNLLVTYNK